MKMTLRAVVKSVFYSTLVVGTGVLLLKYTVPTEEKFIEKLSDGLKTKVKNQKSEVLERHKLFQQVIQSNAESDLPIWDVRGLDSLPKKQ